MLFCILVFFFSDYPLSQICGFICLSFIQLCYILYVIPYEDPSHHYLEVFNESCILVIGYFLLGFTDLTDDPGIKYNCGWLFIAFFIANSSVNILFIVNQERKNVWMKLKWLILIIKRKLQGNTVN
jgi:hypothetical protein